MKNLKEYIPDLDRCVRCGSCRGGCPTLGAIRREWGSARGRLALIRAHIMGNTVDTAVFKKHIKDCTLCGVCEVACPNDIKVTDIILAARAELVDKEGLPLGASLVMKGILDAPKLGPLALKAASKFQKLLGSKEGKSVLDRFKMPYMPMGGPERSMPKLASTFFLETKEARAYKKPPSEMPGGIADGPVVAFFAGCAVNYLMPDLGLKTLELLAKHGARIVVPQAQACCGMPPLSMGDMNTAKSLALKNLEAFEGLNCDYITTPCATCTYGIKETFYNTLSGEGPEVKARIDRFAEKVRDITDLMVNVLKIESGQVTSEAGIEKRSVTYHDPCHLARGLGIRDEPREIIERSGVEFREMKNPCRCCGLGGGVGYSNYELSSAIAREKAERVSATGADILATACPGCMIQIKDSLDTNNVDVEVKHVIELL